MNTKHISLAFAAAAALLASCAKSPIEEVKPSEQLTDLELTHVGSNEVKSVIDGKTFPEEGEIGLFLFEDENATQDYGDGYKNVKYAYNSSKSKWTASPSIKVGSTPGHLYGYYPYNSESTDVKEIPVASSLNGDDVMYASKQVEPITDKTASQTAITMNHALARVSIKVINNSYTGKAELSKIKFSGAKIAQEGTLNALDGKITATNSDVTLDVPTANQTITATGSTYECLLVPSGKDESKQAVDLTLTIDDKDMTATLSGDNGVIIAQNTKSNITITLSNKGISVSSVSIDEWKEVEVGGHKVTVKLSEDAGIENDVYLNATTDGSSVTIKALTTLTGRFTKCTCTPAGKATCNPLIDATTGICTFTITDVQDDITAEVGYLKCNATIEYDSDMGSVKLNGVAVASGSPVQFFGGEEVKFLAEAKSGCGFVKWTDSSDEDLSTDNPYTISSVTSDITLKAIFGGLVEISAEVKPAGAGTVMGAGIYAKGSTATLTAIAGEGFAFTGWAKSDSPGTIISTDNPYEFTVSQSASYVAVFKLKDALSGVFTVAANDQGNPTKKVLFSKGNLWYGKVGDASEATFNFEANQYDTTPSSTDARDENHISHFMWCDDATNAMTLKYDNEWKKDETFFAGKNFTVNGYSGWCTLSTNEWKYLFNTRTVNGGQGAGKSYSLNITYGGKKGLVLYPDDYDKDPVTGTVTDLPDGVVFLPAAGYRDGFNGDARVVEVVDEGYYWSASPHGGNDAYGLSFYSDNVDPRDFDARNRAQSVRLVTECQ